jgi:hypothetical protein
MSTNLGHLVLRRLTVKLGDPIEIEVEIVNRGNRPATLAFGPLASSFAFAVRGVSAQTPVFTGPLGIRTLPPGGTFSLSADLRSFVKLDHAGEYDVACTLNLEALGGETYPMHPSARWDLPLQDTLHIRVL